MSKLTKIIVLIPIMAMFMGCNNTSENNEFSTDQIEMENQIAEQERKIGELEKAQAEQEKMRDEEARQSQIEECQKTKEKCKSKIAIIGTEEIELFNDHGTSYGVVKGDRNKAIEKLKEEIKKDEKYIEEKEDEIDDWDEGGTVYKVTKESIEKKKDIIDRNEKKMTKIEELIIQEQNQRNALLSGECKDYAAVCE